MRLLQNISVYRGYRPHLRSLISGCRTYDAAMLAFLEDRYSAAHLLKPILDREREALLTIGDCGETQRIWAREHGMSRNASPAEILLAQIEEHRTEVFYNMDPVRFDDEFAGRLPGTVKASIAWRAAPSPHERFAAYDLVVNNFPRILADYADKGIRTGYFFPAHDPVLDEFARNADRPVDVAFVGGYTQNHRRRAEILEALTALGSEVTVALYLDRSRMTRLAETPLGLLPPLRRLRRPKSIRDLSRPGVFGRKLYEVLGRAKIVLNVAIDMAGHERGNLRCFEVMGSGAVLLSDDGAFPEGMLPGKTLFTYSDAKDCVARVLDLLSRPQSLAATTEAAYRVVTDVYSKERQWKAFQALCCGQHSPKGSVREPA